MKKFLGLMGLLALVMVLGVPVIAQDGCDDEIGCVELGPDDPIVLGYMLTTSGPFAPLGVDSEGGIELAVEGRDGQILGRDIVVEGEDSLCASDGGQAAAQRLASDEEILGVVGTSCSSAASAALPIISDAGLVMISPSNTAPTLTNPDEEAGGEYRPGYYRTAHNDLFQGAMAAEFAYNELGARTLATIHDGSPYADGLQQVMADTFAEMGGEVTFQGAVNVGDTDMSAILTDIASDAPDLLYYPVFEPESNFITSQARQTSGLEDTTLMSADGSLSETFPENSGEAAIGMFLSGPQVTGEDYQEFLATWEEEIGGTPPSGFHAHAYDATNLLLNAIEEVAVEGEDGTVIIGRQAIRDALNSVEGYDGLTGQLTCQTEAPFVGDCATGEALAVFQITEAEVNDDNWPPPVFWTMSDMEEDMDMDMEATEEADMEDDMEDEGEEDSDG